MLDKIDAQTLFMIARSVQLADTGNGEFDKIKKAIEAIGEIAQASENGERGVMEYVNKKMQNAEEWSLLGVF